MITSRRVSTLMPPLWATTFYVVFLKIREFLSQEPTPLTTGELASPRNLTRPSASALEGRHDSYTPPCMKDDQSAHISCKSSCRAHRYQKTAEPNYVSSALAATGRIRSLLRRQLATRGLRERQTLLLGNGQSTSHFGLPSTNPWDGRNSTVSSARMPAVEHTSCTCPPIRNGGNLLLSTCVSGTLAALSAS